MAEKGRLTPDKWGGFMPAQNPQTHQGPWYYRDTEMVMVEFLTDRDAILNVLPSDLELFEPASAFMVIEKNHWTTVGPYGEVYLGVMCNWEGVPHAYLPGVYVTGENAQIVGREVWGFGKKRPHRIDLTSHEDGQVEAIMEVKEGDRALRAMMKPQQNAPKDALGETPLVCLKIIPDVEGGAVPSLAQLTTVTFKATPHEGPDGKAEVFTGPGFLNLEDPSDVQIPVIEVLRCSYARFTADLPYGKVLKTYTEEDFLSRNS